MLRRRLRARVSLHGKFAPNFTRPPVSVNQKRVFELNECDWRMMLRVNVVRRRFSSPELWVPTTLGPPREGEGQGGLKLRLLSPNPVLAGTPSPASLEKLHRRLVAP